ncbi:hypothetical protein Bpfe_001994 [Biomphalaria pfeifferi]|uniref:Uncharacterized protein n=1 Tax=Biomphalaria pfeifferi TaxID=112525 RepID=A0AAD8FM16_BIOPF|nr:hypothetical protein Bpfe_001994 [Biomphalaria pfeifferi]
MEHPESPVYSAAWEDSKSSLLRCMGRFQVQFTPLHGRINGFVITEILILIQHVLLRSLSVMSIAIRSSRSTSSESEGSRSLLVKQRHENMKK